MTDKEVYTLLVLKPSQLVVKMTFQVGRKNCSPSRGCVLLHQLCHTWLHFWGLVCTNTSKNKVSLRVFKMQKTDSDKLISEVEKHPALWNMKTREYIDRVLKTCLQLKRWQWQWEMDREIFIRSACWHLSKMGMLIFFISLGLKFCCINTWWASFCKSSRQCLNLYPICLICM